MTLKEAVDILEIHQKWRRGAEIPQVCPTKLGIALDMIVKRLNKHLSNYPHNRITQESSKENDYPH